MGNDLKSPGSESSDMMGEVMMNMMSANSDPIKFSRGDNATEKFFKMQAYVPMMQKVNANIETVDEKPKTKKKNTETDDVDTTTTEEFDVISLDDLLNETIEEKTGLVHSLPDDLERETFRCALQCCLLPVSSTVKFGSNAIVDLKEAENLSIVLKNAFPWIETVDGEKTVLDRTIREQNSAMKKRDITRDVIKARMAQVEEDRHYFFKPENFEVRLSDNVNNVE
jgi:Cft2 family RNA processing exonuclease